MSKAKPSVLIVNDHGNVTGGSAQVAIVSACLLKEAGFEVEYFCAAGPVDDRLKQAGVAVTCLNQIDILQDPNRLRAAAQGIWNLPAAKALEDRLSHYVPQSTIVHIHGWTKALTASVFTVCKRLGFKTVHTLHEFFTACPNGGFFDYQKLEICHRQALSAACVTTNCDARSAAQKGWRVVRQFVSRSYADIPHCLTDVVYLSNLQRSVLQPYYAKNTNWHNIPNPIDIAKLPAATPADRSQFLFVGRLVPEKGADLFVQACAAAGVKACVVGDGGQRADLEQRFPGIEFTGWLSTDEVKERLINARALVLPSRWYEGQPLVVQEALAYGVPVIVSDSNGATEVIQHGENGLVFRSGQTPDLVEKINQLRDDSLVRSMGQTAYNRYWSSPPTSRSHLEALSAVYAACLAR